MPVPEKMKAENEPCEKNDRWGKVARLWEIIDRLRGENGCPWDRQQTPESVQTYLVEEAHEAAAAVRAGAVEEASEELGDVLFMVLFLIHLYEEAGRCTLEAVCDRIADKMIRRHPHVFGTTTVDSAADVRINWEKIKEKEKKDRPLAELGVPDTLPALIRAYRVLSRAKSVEVFGLPAEDEESALLESLSRLGRTQEMEKEQASHEIARALLALVALARRHGLRPEDCLHAYLNRAEQQARDRDPATASAPSDQSGSSQRRASMTA
ncbi:MAG: MazG family protein [Desulfosoma sp.]